MIIGLSGLSGAGKDTVADVLVRKHNFVKVSLADPLKRIARDVYDFSDLQLWGPSEERNKPDKRYPREHTWIEGSWEAQCVCCGVRFGTGRGQQCYLTPRYALQMLGTEWGRHCYPNTWVDYAIRIAKQLRAGGCYYDQKTGPRFTTSVEGVMTPRSNVVIPDCRFKNEFSAVGKEGHNVRVKRPGYEKPKWDHPSETEQLEVDDEGFSHILGNNSTVGDLDSAVVTMLEKLVKDI